MSTPRCIRLERAAYTLAAPVLAAAPNVDPTSPLNLGILCAGATGLIGTALSARSPEGAGRKILRCSPFASAGVVDLLATLTPAGATGTTIDALLAAGWATTGMLVRPFTCHTRRHHRPSLATTAELATQPAAVTAELTQREDAPVNSPVSHLGSDPTSQPGSDPISQPGSDPISFSSSPLSQQARTLWERAGTPGNTLLVTADRHQAMPNDMTILLRAIQPGRPVSKLTKKDVAAAFGVDETDVDLASVSRQHGRHGGPGWMEARITPDANRRRREEPTAAERWTDRVAAKGAAPGSELVDVRRDQHRGVTFYRAKMTDPTDTPQIDLAKVCRGLGEPEDDSRVFLLTDGSEFLISVFDDPPLSRIFPATKELLTPDAKGMYVCGYATTGQPVQNMVYQHDKNAACHGLILGVTRSGKTQYFAISMAAEAIAGAVVWLGTVRRDEKTTELGQYIASQGSSPIFMARQLRAAKALCEIRAEMPWPHDGKPHDYKPGDPRCPYRPLNLYEDEFMTAAQDSLVGEDILTNGDDLTVTGLKYGIGMKIAGQSPFAHSGFSTEMKDNLRQNSRAVIFNMGSPRATKKAAEGTMENPSDVPTIPARYARQEGSAIERAIAGEADPENGVSTGGVAVIVLDNGRATLMRSLYADFDHDLSHLFPEINQLTDHEITELDKRGLWFDWNDPPYPGEFGPAPRDDDDDPPPQKPTKKRKDAATTPAEALETIKNLTKT